MADKKRIGTLGWVGILVLAGVLFGGKGNNKSSTSSTSSASSVSSASSPTIAASPVAARVDGPNQQAARKVMALIEKDCKIFEEGPHLVVEMKMYIPDKNKLLAYVRTIADSDTVLHGSSRNIYYYDPSGKQIAQADTLSGIRLKD